jgi:hypothetical protein
MPRPFLLVALALLSLPALGQARPLTPTWETVTDLLERTMR